MNIFIEGLAGSCIGMTAYQSLPRISEIFLDIKKPTPVLFALGGNSFIPPLYLKSLNQNFGNENTKEINFDSIQRNTIISTAEILAGLIHKTKIIPLLTHGNGPQIGFLLLNAERKNQDLPLAQGDRITQESIGQIIQEVLGEELSRYGIKRTIKVIITQVLVDINDPAFKNPTKPIGLFYTDEQAEKLKKEKGWVMNFDRAHHGWRRVVASPKPIEIIEIEEIREAMSKRESMICCGGGGIPVIKTPQGLIEVDAVIDKDLTSALLAVKLGIKLMIISTAEQWIYKNFMKPNQSPLKKLTLRKIRKIRSKGIFDEQFPSGSVGPKINAAEFLLTRGGRKVFITSPDHISDLNGTKAVRGIDYYIRKALKI